MTIASQYYKISYLIKYYLILSIQIIMKFNNLLILTLLALSPLLVYTCRVHCAQCYRNQTCFVCQNNAFIYQNSCECKSNYVDLKFGKCIYILTLILTVIGVVVIIICIIGCYYYFKIRPKKLLSSQISQKLVEKEQIQYSLQEQRKQIPSKNIAEKVQIIKNVKDEQIKLKQQKIYQKQPLVIPQQIIDNNNPYILKNFDHKNPLFQYPESSIIGQQHQQYQNKPLYPKIDDPLPIMKKQSCHLCGDSNWNYRTSCNHTYHLECLKQWLVMRKFCPACDKVLSQYASL